MNVLKKTSNDGKSKSDSHLNSADLSNLSPDSGKISLTDDNSNEDSNDVDLSNVIPSIINPNMCLDNSIIIGESNEAFKDIINVCSSNAEALKKTISDVLSSRSNVIISEVDETSELEESLNKKIADFNITVDGCLRNDSISSVNKSEINCALSENIEEDLDSKQKFNRCFPEIITSMQEEIGNSDTSSESSTCSSAKNTVTCSQKNKVVPPSSISNKGTKKTIFNQASKNESSNTEKEKDFLKASLLEEEKKLKTVKSLSRKKGEKTMDQVLKSLSNYSSYEDKLHQLCKKYLEVLEEFRSTEPKVKQLERQVMVQQREKEVLQSEHNRMILAKSRLEGLCREMQRQSKAIKEESLIRIKEEEEKRKEVANKFQSTLNDISGLMQENSKRNTALRAENAELSTKLKMLVDNYSTWEENMKKIVQHKELETQLANAKYAKVNLELKQETEKFLREKQSLLENMSELQKKCTLLTANELQLRTELGDYTKKYEEFQSVLTNSSKVFSTFKADMDATSKKIKKLEKETNVYKQKWESSNKALLDMISNKEQQDRENANAQQRILTLEKLCRALQSERNDLRNQLNAATSHSGCMNEQNVPLPSSESSQ